MRVREKNGEEPSVLRDSTPQSVLGELARGSSAIIMEIGRSSIQFTRCARGTAFLPKIMESPRGSSAIIMEIGRSSIQFKRCARGKAFLPKIMESPRGSSAIIMEIGC